MTKNIKVSSTIVFLIIFFIGIYLRVYQIHFDDYWYDEYASFWVADPSLSFSETLKRSYNFHYGNNLVFDIILKYFFIIFNYDPEIGRYLPLFFGICSIPLLTYLSYQLDKDKSYLFTAFLASISWYLISYSQETRCYSFSFFLATLSLIFFIKITNNNLKKNNQYFFSILYIFSTFIGLSNHIFFFIIVLSQTLFLLIKFNLYKKKILFISCNIFIAVILYFAFMYKALILQLSINDFWITQVKSEFFVSYYFSRFFGSKIMGSIYLCTLIYLIFKEKNKFFYNQNKHLLLLIILFLSYGIPLIYGFIIKPILIDRYIIFVLIPIFLIISNLTLSLKNVKIKKIILFTIIFSTLGNNYLEIFNRIHSKPEFNKILDRIAVSDTKYIYLKAPDKTKQSLINYIQLTKSYKNNHFKILDKVEVKKKINFWQVCYQPINNFNCDLDDNSKSFTLRKTIKFHLIEATLYSSNIKS